MALTPSGAISLGDINTATGKSSTAPISMNGTAVRCISDTSNGAAVSMSQLRSKNCAGGSITVGTNTSTSKGVTTIYYGRTQFGQGSVTLGNITTYPNLTNVTAIQSLQTTAASNNTPAYSNWVGQFNMTVTPSPGSINARIRIGSNNVMTTVSTVTFVGPNNLINTLAARNPTGIMTSADVGQTLDWVITQV